MRMMELSENELQELYTWVDQIPLSRPKRNISRDFSDGVLMAEVLYHYFPKTVELHNYSSANGMAQKMYNWNTLNQKVLKRINYEIPRSECEKCANAVPGAVEKVLLQVKSKIAAYTKKKSMQPKMSSPPPKLFGGDVPYHSPHAEASAPGGSPHQYHQQPHWINPQGHLSDVQSAQRALADKDAAIYELRETNEILETKVRKLEQLVRLKDAKIQTLLSKLQGPGRQ